MTGPRILTAVALVCIAAQTASAQNSNDHLACYKVKDPLVVKALADFDTASLGVSAGCKISKAALLCEPSGVQNLTTDSTTLRLGGPRSTGERVCYKVRCPARASLSQQVTDEFGTRTITNVKTSLVCSAAALSAAHPFGGLDHYPRGLAQLTETNTSNGPTLHVSSLDGVDAATPDVMKSSTSDPGGSGVVVVLQDVSSYGVRVRRNENSRASLSNSALRVGAVLDMRGHGGEQSESTTDEMSVAVGASGVSSTAYFPRLQRKSAAAVRSGTVTCLGAVAGSATETTPGDPHWTWFSQVWPDHYETASNATTDQAVFTWETGCVAITSPDGSGTTLVGDRLVISMDNGSSPALLHRVQITGAGGLAAFALKDETTH